MNDSNNNDSDSDIKSVAGGFFFALCIMIGFFVGVYNGQASAGTIAGFVVGGVIALLIWVKDSKKQQK